MNAYYPSLALLVAGIVFAIVALMHVLRLVYKSRVTFGSKTIPMWVSMLGLVVALLLSAWMFMASCSLKEFPAVEPATVQA